MRGWGLGILLSVIGVGLLIGGGALWRRNHRFEAIARATEGVVVSTPRARPAGGGKPVYQTIVRFSTEAGREIEIKGSVSSSSRSYSQGDKVKVLYDPATPEAAQIDSFMERRFGLVILCGLGTVFSLMGAGALAARMRTGL